MGRTEDAAGPMAGQKPKQAASSFRYDAFISYGPSDENWVRNWLLPRLEKAKIRYCIDFEPGAPKVREIARAVSESRKTVLILTPSYMDGRWQEFGENLVLTLDLAARQRRLIPVLLERCELPLHLDALTPVDLTDPDTRSLVCDEKLIPVLRQGTELSRVTLPWPVQWLHRTRRALLGIPRVIRMSTLIALMLLVLAWPRLSPLITKERAIAGHWIKIPAGEFIMGVDETEARLALSFCYDDNIDRLGGAEDCDFTQSSVVEKSDRRADAWLAAFQIMDNEVTNAQYKMCVDASKCPKPAGWVYDSPTWEPSDANKPVTNVDWFQAMAYCQAFLGGRLPTEEEWEKAARGPDGNLFPWGQAWDPTKANLVHFTSGSSTSIAAYADTDVSYYGVKNMAGNVREWTASEFVDFSVCPFENDAITYSTPYDPTKYDPQKDPLTVTLKGGASRNSRSEGMGSSRAPRRGRGLGAPEIGFRCVCPSGRSCESPWGLWWVWLGDY